MSLLFKTLGLNFAPLETPSSNTGVSGEMSKDDILAALNEGDDNEPDGIIDLDPPKDKKGDKTKETEDDKTGDDDEDDDTDKDDKEDDKEVSLEDELEDDLAEVDDEKLELKTPVSRREILKKYPKLFKEFPYLETAYYREQKFTEMFPTMDDAQEAIDGAKTLANLEADVSKGDIKRILLATQSAGSYNNVVNDLLKTLQEVDPNSHTHVVGNIVKQCIYDMAKESEAENDPELKKAALILNKFIFGTSKYTPPSKLEVKKAEENPEKEQLNRERQELHSQKMNDARENIDKRVSNAIKSTIDGNIDPATRNNPDGQMSEYVKRQATREAVEEVTKLIGKDTRFKIIIDRLYLRAAKNGFKAADLDQIRATYLSKAKTLLPSVIKKARNEALKGMGKRVKEENNNDDEKDETPKRKSSNTRDSESPRSRTSGKSSDIPKGMTTLEYLEQE